MSLRFVCWVQAWQRQQYSSDVQQPKPLDKAARHHARLVDLERTFTEPVCRQFTLKGSLLRSMGIRPLTQRQGSAPAAAWGNRGATV